MTDLSHVKMFESFENLNDLDQEEVERLFDLGLIGSDSYVGWLVDHGLITDADTAIVEVGVLGAYVPGAQNMYTIWYYDGVKDLLNSSKDMKSEILRKMKETGAQFVYVKDLEALLDDQFRTLYRGKITQFHLKAIPKAVVIPKEDQINENSTELTREEADHLFDRKLLSPTAYLDWMNDHEQFNNENTATVRLPITHDHMITVVLNGKVEYLENPMSTTMKLGPYTYDMIREIAKKAKEMGAEFFYVDVVDPVTFTADGIELGPGRLNGFVTEEVPSANQDEEFYSILNMYDRGLLDPKALYDKLESEGYLTTDYVAIAYMNEERDKGFFMSVVRFGGSEIKTEEGNVLNAASKMNAEIVCLMFPATPYSTEGTEIRLVDGTLLSHDMPASLIVPERWVDKRMRGQS